MVNNPNAVVIGYGYAGRNFHSYLIGLDSGLNLHGVMSRNPETRARITAERGCRTYTEFDEVIGDPDVHLVVLATPNDTHADLAIRAMDAGKHVVTDKPMCVTLAECDSMIDAARRNRVLLSVFQNRRWDGDFLTLGKLLAGDELGDLRWLEMAWQTPRASGGWRGLAVNGGGKLFDLGAHMLDQVLLVFPRAVTSVYCRMHHDYDDRDIESHAMLVLGFEGGATAVIDAGGMHFVPKPRIQAFGTRGTYVKHGLDPQEKAMNAGDIDLAREEESAYGVLRTADGEKKIPTTPGRWRNYYEIIAAQITGRTHPEKPVCLEQTRRVMTVFDAAFESAREGNVVVRNISD